MSGLFVREKQPFYSCGSATGSAAALGPLLAQQRGDNADADGDQVDQRRGASVEPSLPAAAAAAARPRARLTSTALRFACAVPSAAIALVTASGSRIDIGVWQ